MESNLTFAENLARQTGDLLASYFQLSGIQAQLKADRSVVTEADYQADAFIKQAIRHAYPDDLILTEESAAVRLTPGKALWVVDPLDGTTNFSLGLHTWGVSIARLQAGKPNTAALYFPIYGELYSAQAGNGAFLNGIPLHTPPVRPDIPTAFFTCCSNTMRRYQVNLRYKFRLLGSAAYDFCLVARGAAIGGFQAIPKIWDIAGGWLILAEAGSVVELHGGGSPFSYPGPDPAPEQSFPTVMAANREIADQLQIAIQKR